MPETPALLIDQDALTTAAAAVAERGQAWRYQGDDIRAASDATERVAIPSLARLEDVPDGADVLVTRALLDPQPLAEVMSRLGRVMLTVEHFVHVEAIERVTWPQPPDVVLEVAVGPGRFGGRPGSDAVELGTVLARSESFRWRGLSAEVTSVGMADALLQTREQIVDRGLACDFVTVRCEHELAGQLPSGLEVRHDAGAVRGVVVTVIGRPTLETVVIDLGLEAGLTKKQSLTFRSWTSSDESTVRVRLAEPSRALLTLPEHALDVVIGDHAVVTVVPTGPFHAAPVVSPGSF